MSHSGFAATQQVRKSRTSGYPVWLLTGFWISVVIAIGAVARRLMALGRPAGGRTSSPAAAMDAFFSSHAVLTAAHIIPAAIFVLLAAFLLFRPTGAYPSLERVFFLLGAITGGTAYAMSSHPVGGSLERSAVLVFDTWFLVSLGRVFWFSLRGDTARQRDWMVRAMGVLLGIATTRPVMGVFFATSTRTHLSFSEFFGMAFWIGFSINTVAVELWLRSRVRSDLK